MPRDGSGVFSAPAGTLATSNTTILSANHNAFVNDLVLDANAARPITAGGTGADTAIGAHDGLVTKGTDVESAATLNLSTATGAFVDITGTTTVTAVTLGEGKQRMARAAAAFQLTASASLVVNGSTSVNYTTTAGDLLIFEGYASNVVRVWVVSPTPSLAAFPTGHLYGMEMSNGSDATNDITFNTGTCRDSTDNLNIVVTGAQTKQLDAAYAAGTNAGGRFDSSISDGTWHCYAISDGTNKGFGFSKNLDPSGETNYPGSSYKYRRVGSIIRSSGAILAFTQRGDEFLLKPWVTDVNANSMGTSAVNRTLTVPTGIKVDALMNVGVAGGTSANARGAVYSPDESDPTLSTNFNVGFTNIASANVQMWTQLRTRTNTSAQVVSKFIASAADIQLWITTRGWVDTRGRNTP